MPLNHPTDSSYVLDDGLTRFDPAASTVVAGKFGAATKSAALTLSTDATRVTHPAANASNTARSDVAIVGEAYYEFTIKAMTIPTDSTTAVGLINGTLTNYDTYLTNTNTAALYAPGGSYGAYSGFGINNAQQQATALGATPWVVGTVIGMAVSMSAKTVKFTLDGTTYSPAYDITALGTTIYPAIGLYHINESIQINAGKAPFVHPVPSGYAGPDISTTTYYGFGTVSGVDKVYDMGEETVPSGWLAQFEFSQIDKTDGENNNYYFVMVGSLNPDLSDYEEVSNRWQASVVGTKPLVAFSTLSRASNVLLRYFGVLKILSGASPSVTAYCFMQPLGDLSLYTVNEAIQILCFMADNDVEAFAQFRAWMTGVAWGGVNHDGVYPVSDGYGNITYLKSPAQLQAEGALNSPQYYGAIGDGMSHPASDFYDTLEDLQVKYDFAKSLYQEMDFLGTQAALYHGGGVSSVYSNFVMCNSHAESQEPLIAISGTFDIMVHGSIWSFPDMIEQTDDTQFVTNADFASSGSWVNASVYGPGELITTTFGSGAATMIDTGTGTTPGQSTFYQWGQELDLEPGRYTVTMTASATMGASYALGNFNPPYVDISFSASSPGAGGNPIGRSAGTRFNVFPEGVTDTKELTFDFQLEAPMTVWLTWTGGGYMDCQCTHFGIKKWLSNCAILATRDGSPIHYPIPRGFDGLELIGSGNVTAVKYKSFSNTDGNVIRFSNSAIHDWSKGFSFSDGAYLTEFSNVDIYNCGTGLFTESGTLNAGENLRLIGGKIYNCAVGIDGQGGMEITLDTTALDYCTQAIVNAQGRYELSNVHTEMRTPLADDKPLFHLIGGQITMFGGMVLIADTPYTSPCAMIKTEYSTATFECFGTELYNLSSDPSGDGKGAIIEGPGQFITHGWLNKGNPNIGPLVVTYAPVMDVLGGAGFFPVATPYTQDPTNILIEGGNYSDIPAQINITASITGSIMTVTSTPTFPLTEGMQVRGTGIKGVPILTFIPGTGGTGYAGTYLVSIPQTIASSSLTAGSDGQIDRWNTEYGTLEWSDEYTLDGSNCLKFTKSPDIGTGLNVGIRLLIPATPRSTSLGIMHFLFPIDYSPVDPTETVQLYYRLFWVRSIGNDVYGRPIIVKEWFAGETDLTVPRAGSLDWQLRSLSTTHVDITGDPSTATSTHSQEGATHLAVYLDTQPLPGGQVFYIAKMIDNMLR